MKRRRMERNASRHSVQGRRLAALTAACPPAQTDSVAARNARFPSEARRAHHDQAARFRHGTRSAAIEHESHQSGVPLIPFVRRRPLRVLGHIFACLALFRLPRRDGSGRGRPGFAQTHRPHDANGRFGKRDIPTAWRRRKGLPMRDRIGHIENVAFPPFRSILLRSESPSPRQGREQSSAVPIRRFGRTSAARHACVSPLVPDTTPGCQPAAATRTHRLKAPPRADPSRARPQV